MVKRFVRIFNTLVLIVFAVILADFFGLYGSDKNVSVTIGEGDGISAIASKLQDEHIVISKYLFNAFCKIGGADIKINPGTVTVNSSMSYKEILNAVEKASDSQITVTIPEGFENREISDRLFSNDIISSEDEFNAALKHTSFTLDDGTVVDGSAGGLSGYLFPDTYNFYKNTPSDDVIKVMTSNFKAHWLSEYTDRCKELDMTVNEAVILASIIEREANNAADFKTVSSVFHNRLNTGMKLESCATVQYILEERKSVLSLDDVKIKSPYNTYIVKGLPPAAISSPGITAIEAALYPDETEYLFFFVDKNGTTHFSKTNEEHNALIEKHGL